ncbi:hypothetical protein [Streptomyces sp. NPDC018693]|uniref:DUF7848 domain-containing protein n=1 Tax=unclassified Streptomyces TaxID=2593676 RepID=UPI0037BD4792
METTAFEPGMQVYDPATNKVGEYQGKAGPYALLRPVGGGREWEADPALIRPATQAERIGAGVRAANRRTHRPSDDLGRPPAPVPGCGTCTDLAGRRDQARARHDASAVTDANVLLRRHQEHEHTTTRTRRVFRYVPYSIVQDATAMPEYEARCVSGDEKDCGAESGVRHDPAQVEEWQRKHSQQTHHLRYRRVFGDYAVLEPQEEARGPR